MFTIAMADQADSPQVAVLDLKTGQRKTLIRGGSDAQYVETGHLIFAAAGALRAVRFDLARLEVLGDPVTVVEHVLMKPTGAADYAVSRQGTLVYVPSGTDERTDAVARVGRPEGARGTHQGAAACLRSPAHIARRHARGGHHLRSGEH